MSVSVELIVGMFGLDAAEKMFTNKLLEHKRKAAEAAFQLGTLANNRIDYRAAYEHYTEAATLQPENQEYLEMLSASIVKYPPSIAPEPQTKPAQ